MTPRERYFVGLTQAGVLALAEFRAQVIPCRAALARGENVDPAVLVKALDDLTQAQASLRTEFLRISERTQELADTEPPESPFRRATSILERAKTEKP